jgi:hypothetical protein
MNVFLRYIITLFFACAVLGSCIRIPSPSIDIDKETSLDSLSKKERRAYKKVARLNKKYPKIMKSDSSSSTETKTKLIELEKEFYDANKEQQAQEFLDSLLYELSKKCPGLDSAVKASMNNTPSVPERTNIRNSILQNITVEKLLKPMVIDTAGAKVFITPKGNTLNVKVQLPVTEKNTLKKKITVVPCQECPELGFWEALWMVRWVIGGLIATIFLLFGLIVIMK